MEIYRREIKYIISKKQYSDMVRYMDNFLDKDEHSRDKPYTVNSVYFDSINNIDFYEKMAGLPNRKKIRLRYYNDDESYYRLEKKEKFNDNQIKKGFEIKKEDALEVTEGRYECLHDYFGLSSHALEIYMILTQGLYRPVVKVAYDRIAYTHSLYDTRVTFDSNIRKKEGLIRLKHDEKEYNSVDSDQAVLEVKFSGKCPQFITDCLRHFELEQNSYSKYCSSRIQYYTFNY